MVVGQVEGFDMLCIQGVARSCLERTSHLGSGSVDGEGTHEHTG